MRMRAHSSPTLLLGAEERCQELGRNWSGLQRNACEAKSLPRAGRKSDPKDQYPPEPCIGQDTEETFTEQWESVS